MKTSKIVTDAVVCCLFFACRRPQALTQLRQALQRKGYCADRAVPVQVAPAQMVRRICASPRDELADAPDTAWAALFLGDGIDPVDGAKRVRSMSRAEGSLFACLREHGQTVAAGAGAFSHGWASVHGMRTATANRGKGYASQVLAALAQAALGKQLERIFLQLEEGNTAAEVCTAALVLKPCGAMPTGDARNRAVRPSLAGVVFRPTVCY